MNEENLSSTKPYQLQKKNTLIYAHMQFNGPG